MKPAPFDYHAPESAAEALDLLARYGADARLLAGGQSLVPLLNFRLSAPAVIVDLNRASDLAYIREESGRLRIGATTRQRRDRVLAAGEEPIAAVGGGDAMDWASANAYARYCRRQPCTFRSCRGVPGRHDGA
jgi:hypothetical protein